MEPIGKVLSDHQFSSQKGGLKRSLDAAVIIAKANKCSDGTWVATIFKQQQLILVANSAIAAQELYWRRESVLDTINSYLGQPLIKDLIIRS